MKQAVASQNMSRNNECTEVTRAPLSHLATRLDHYQVLNL
jgi:hypothetical protein